MEPFLELIQQREQMLLDIQTLGTEPPKAQAKKTERIDPKEEQHRRRLKTLLPRLERKLVTMLIEFRQVNGFDLEWDGEPYIGTLSHIILSDMEVKAIRGKARKRSFPKKQGQEATGVPSCGGRKLSKTTRISGH
jgi:hypothetical protein